MIIHYCDKCGQRLQDSDVASGAAGEADQRFFCAQCAPPRHESKHAKVAASTGALPAASPHHSSTRHTSQPRPSAAQPASARVHAAPPASKTPILIAGGVGVAALVLAVVFLAGKLRTSATEATAQKKDTPEKKSDATVVPRPLVVEVPAKAATDTEPAKASAAAPTPPAVDTVAGGDDAWKNAVDLLKLARPSRDTVAGGWSLRDGTLTSCSNAQSKAYPRMMLPYVPPAEYDLRVVFTRKQNEDCLFVYLVRDGHQFGWMLGAWKNTVAGFDTFKGKRAHDIPENVKSGPILETGRRHTAIAQVRTSGVRCFLDGKLISETKAPASDFAVVAHWTLPDSTCLGLGNGHNVLEIHQFQVVELSGKGRIME